MYTWNVIVLWIMIIVAVGLCRAQNMLIDSVPKWVRAEGYPVETHDVVSQGYIMRVHRIPRPNRPAVLIVHGLFCSSVDWVFHGPKKALGYLLYDAGFDVWLANLRGTPASMRHVHVNSTQTKFWDFRLKLRILSCDCERWSVDSVTPTFLTTLYDFSIYLVSTNFHEHGVYDLTAFTDYIISVTRQQKLHFIGNSMAGAAIFAALSELPRYNDKFHQVILYAPHTNMAHVTGPVAIIAPYRRLLAFAADTFRVTNFPLFDNNAVLDALHRTCKRKDYGASLCLPLHNFFLGNFAAVNYTLFVESTRFYPISTSIKTLLHVLQTVRTGTFSQYDYGEQKNLLRYKSIRPPSYNMSRVTVPIVIFHSRKDNLVPPQDIEWLKSQLSNILKTIFIDRPDFAHTSYLFHPEVRKLVYEDTVKLIVDFK